MRAGDIIRFTRHIANMGFAGGKKRIAYAIGNIFIMALGAFFGWCVFQLWAGVSGGDINFIVGIVGLFITIPLTLFTFLQGFVAQIALVFITLVGIIAPGERLSNAFAFIISVASTVGLTAAIIIMIRQ